MYVMVCSRHDLAHAVSQVSKYMPKPEKHHWEAVKWILRYLKGTMAHVIVFGSQQSNPILIGYVDSDYAGDIDNRRSTIGRQHHHDPSPSPFVLPSHPRLSSLFPSLVSKRRQHCRKGADNTATAISPPSAVVCSGDDGCKQLQQWRPSRGVAAATGEATQRRSTLRKLVAEHLGGVDLSAVVPRSMKQMVAERPAESLAVCCDPFDQQKQQR
nr:Retrovirus-related Pol polyprotein from transposon TNT 1-94 [Ipomoea batatas]